MSKKRFLVFGFLGVGLLLASLAVATVSAFPNGTIREKTFVTYYGTPIGKAGEDSYNAYAYGGIHWAAGTLVSYSVNPNRAPQGAVAAVEAAFETWDAQTSNELFNDNGGIVSRNVAGSKYDGINVVSWGRLGQGIIAQTTVWYNSNLEIVEFGMVFNTAYRWGIDVDGEGGAVLANAFDVQNIATHEAGHTLMLEDLYMPEASALTMYGYGDYEQTYARSLGTGDISGIAAIYP